MTCSIFSRQKCWARNYAPKSSSECITKKEEPSMKDSARYYEEKLYPLQNGVLNIVNNAKTPFFLTGGTALSRYYLGHRYSDDLDFFVVQNTEYSQLVNMLLKDFFAAEKQGHFIVDRGSISKSEAHTLLFIAQPSTETELKIEFVNDIAVHYGDILNVATLGRIDSLQNILSNKLSALFRSEPKDVADIYAIAMQQKELDWRKIVTEAKSKEVGADPEILYDILRSFPLEQLDRIKWVQQPDRESFGKAIKIIAEDILLGRINSLA